MTDALLPRWCAADGFAVPESAAFDARRGEIYVSNMAGSDVPPPRSGNGSLSRLSTDGEVIDARWVTGLHQPKNIAVHEGHIYAADSRCLTVVDIEAAKIVERYEAPDSFYLDGLTVHPDGDVYVGDLAENTIWKLDRSGGWGPWLQSEFLCHPDGLVAEATRLVVAGFGFNVVARAEPRLGHLTAVDYQTGVVEPIGAGTPIGHLDGVASDGTDGYLAVDHLRALLLHIDSDGNHQTLYAFPPGSGPGDVTFVPQLGVVIVALLYVGQVVALPWPPVSADQPVPRRA
jgi:hypothetical protein